MTNLLLLLAIILILLYAVKVILYQKIITSLRKEAWPKGPGFGLPLKGAILLKAVQVKSA